MLQQIQGSRPLSQHCHRVNHRDCRGVKQYHRSWTRGSVRFGLRRSWKWPTQLIAARREPRPRTVGDLPMQSVPMAPTKPKMYTITAVITMSISAATGSNGSTRYSGLIMCAQKTKSRIDCAQPMRTRTDQITCQPAIYAAITSPTLLGLVTTRCSLLPRLAAASVRRNPRSEVGG